MLKHPIRSIHLANRSLFDWRSFRNAFVALGALVTAGTGLTLWVDLVASFNQAAVAERARIERRVTHISARIADILSDLRLIAGTPSLQRHLETDGAANLAEVQQEFAVFVEAKQIYDQARYLDETGMERVRVDLSAGKAKIVTDAKLQAKGSRYYFTDAIKLSRGEIYISPLDLNIEEGRVETPYKPMIRLATPLFDGTGQRRGIAILNYLGNDLLQRLNGMIEPEAPCIELLNRDGYWLKSARPDQEWGFMFKRQETFATTHPAVWQWLQESPNGQRTVGLELWTWSRLYPLHPGLQSSSGTDDASGPSQADLAAADYYWIALSHMSAGGLLTAYREKLLRYALLWFASLTLVALGSWMLARRQGRLNSANAELKLLSHRNQLILDSAAEGIIGLDEDGRTVFANAAALTMLGFNLSELMGQDFHALTHHTTTSGEPYPVTACPIHLAMRNHALHHVSEDLFWRKDGGCFPVEYRAAPRRDGAGVHGAVVVVSDISQRKQSELEHKAILQTAMDGYLVADVRHGRILDTNDAYAQMIGYSREELLNLCLADLEADEPPDGNPDYRDDLRRSGRARFETRHRCKSGRIIDVEISITRMDVQGGVLVAFVRDATGRKATEAYVRQLAYHDTLTGLPNRRMLMDRLNQALAQAARFQRSLAVMFLDLDHFKQINDTLGHGVGDELLKIVADRLTACVRSGDTVSRQGGDEFVVILAEIAQPQDAAVVATKMIQALSEPIGVQAHTLNVTASIGIAVYPVDGTDDASELMRKADLAMYAAKDQGRNGYRFHHPEELVAKGRLD